MDAPSSTRAAVVSMVDEWIVANGRGITLTQHAMFDLAERISLLVALSLRGAHAFADEIRVVATEQRHRADQAEAECSRWAQLNNEAAGERAELYKALERKNAALARPCINCGYVPKIVRPQ